MKQRQCHDRTLDMEYNEVKTEFIKLFLPNDPTLEKEDENNITTRRGSEEERNFIILVKEKVEEIIITSTLNLQIELDREEEKQIITSMISAKYKKNDTVKATEATALAINDVSPEGQTNMEQHLKNLIDQALKKKEKEKHTSTTPSSPPSNKKRKNSTGGKKPQSSSPGNKGETSKKVSFRYPITNTKEEEEEQPKSKKQKTSKKISNQTPPKKKTQPSLNAKGNQGGKKKGVRRGKKPKKNN